MRDLSVTDDGLTEDGHRLATIEWPDGTAGQIEYWTDGDGPHVVVVGGNVPVIGRK